MESQTWLRVADADNAAVLELDTPERTGLLAAVSQALLAAPVTIIRCEVHPRGARVLHRFHVVGKNGEPIDECCRADLQRRALAISAQPSIVLARLSRLETRLATPLFESVD